ncbi:MAG: hypothetical protein JWO25_1654 [Alphaproteobacteria bacterium]|nr:hypothetical protein [Alphaproteobacteria bacterium]
MKRYRSTAMKRYELRTGLAAAAYIVTLSAALRFVGGGAVTGAPAFALALLPGLSVAGLFWAIGRLMVEETDEYIRMLLVRQALFATGLTLSVTTIWGFLENFGLVPHVETFYIAVLWFAGRGLGAVYNWITLGDSGPSR